MAKLPAIKPDGVTPLVWAALGETTFGRKFPPEYLKYVQDLDGKRVALVGHMRPAAGAGSEPTGFLLTEFPIGCWFCESPDPTGIVNVEMATGKTAPYVRTTVKVVGVFKLNRTDAESFLFTLADASLGVAD